MYGPTCQYSDQVKNKKYIVELQHLYQYKIVM